MLKFGNTFVNVGGTYLKNYVGQDPYNPLDLPPYTVRVRTDGNVPIKGSWTSYETATLVPGTTDVYDVYKRGTNFSWLLCDSANVIEVLGANTTNVTDMQNMFRNCTALQSVPLFDTSKVWNMISMFGYCEHLTTVPLFDTSNVTTMSGMFFRCTRLTTVPLFNTSKVTAMNDMFRNCSSLTTVPLFNTSNVTNMADMFNSCSTLQSVPLFDTSNVTTMSGMFFRCTSLTSIPLFNTSKVTDMNNTFGQTLNVEGGALALYQQASTQTNPPSSHSQTFYNCGSNTQTGAAELAQIPNDWK